MSYLNTDAEGEGGIDNIIIEANFGKMIKNFNCLLFPGVTIILVM